MDFETFGFSVPIPLIDNTRPYDQVPFQFSVHTVESLDATPAHVAWLWDGAGDPRPPFVRQLKAAVGTKGSIVVYNQNFEATRLRECAVICPEYAPWVDKAIGRLADLYCLFRNSAIYYPAQHGSASIKAVLPAVVGKSYNDLAIHDGGQASDEFLRVAEGKTHALRVGRLGMS